MPTFSRIQVAMRQRNKALRSEGIFTFSLCTSGHLEFAYIVTRRSTSTDPIFRMHNYQNEGISRLISGLAYEEQINLEVIERSKTTRPNASSCNPATICTGHRFQCIEGYSMYPL